MGAERKVVDLPSAAPKVVDLLPPATPPSAPPLVHNPHVTSLNSTSSTGRHTTQLWNPAAKERYAVMDHTLQQTLIAGDGIVSFAALRRAGYGLNEVTSMVRSGALVRLWHGRYGSGSTVAAWGKADRHLLTCRAALAGMPHNALSHQSALLAWSLPVLSVDVGDVHMCGVERDRPRRAPGLHVHPAVSPEWVTTRAGVRVVRPALAVAQTSAMLGPRAGLIAADAGLRASLFTRSEVDDAVAILRRPGRAHRVAELTSPLSESPGESWCRLVFADLGLQQPRQQAEILDETGRFVARVDFLFKRERVIVEFDGAVKYGGADGRDRLVAEKRREDAIRRLGYRVIRLTWGDLGDPAQVEWLLKEITA